MNISAFLTPRNILLLILLQALALKMTGLSHGLPYAFRADEESLIGGAMRMIQLKTLIPALYPEMSVLNYPPFLPYLYMAFIVPVLGVLYAISGFPDLPSFKLIVFEQMGAIFFVTRFTSVLFSLGTIWLTYKIALLLLRNPTVALFAAFLQSVDFVSTFTAHFARHWNATTFVIWLAIYFSIHLAHDAQRKYYLLVGLTSGLGFGISYSFGGLGIFAGGIAHLYLIWKRDASLFHLIDRNSLYMGGIFLLLAALSIALYPNAALRLINGEITGLDDAKSFAAWVMMTGDYLQGLMLFNPVLLLLSALAVVLLLIHRRFTALAWGLGTGVFYLTILYLTVPLETRYMIVIIPVFAIGAGYVLAWLFNQALTPVSKFAVYGLTLISLGYPLATSWYESILLQRDDTRVQAITWIEKNLPENAGIVFDLAGALLRPTYPALLDQKALDPNSLNAQFRTLLSSYQSGSDRTDILPGRTYRAIHPQRFNEPILSASRAGEFLDQWIASGYQYYAIQFRSPTHDSALNKIVRSRGERLAVFRPAKTGNALPTYLRSTDLLSRPVQSIFQFERFGPIVEIYKIPPP